MVGVLTGGSEESARHFQRPKKNAPAMASSSLQSASAPFASEPVPAPVDFDSQHWYVTLPKHHVLI